jgi:hypothetical protein
MLPFPDRLVDIVFIPGHDRSHRGRAALADGARLADPANGMKGRVLGWTWMNSMKKIVRKTRVSTVAQMVGSGLRKSKMRYISMAVD